MATAFQLVQLLRFDVFEMDLISRELRKKGIKKKLQEQPFDILTALAMRPRELVIREELYSKLSKHGTYDAKRGLNNAILKVRKALGDSAEKPRFVETVPRRGYRFLVSVEHTVRTSSHSNGNPKLEKDVFQVEVSEIRQRMFGAVSVVELAELLYRVSALIDQQPHHPSVYDARMLLDQVQNSMDYAACSWKNHAKHLISFETAAQVFDDPHALSLNGPGSTWKTLGRVGRGLGYFDQPVLLMVSHKVIPTLNGHEEVRITSARTATPAERKAYEQAAKKRLE